MSPWVRPRSGFMADHRAKLFTREAFGNTEDNVCPCLLETRATIWSNSCITPRSVMTLWTSQCYTSHVAWEGELEVIWNVWAFPKSCSGFVFSVSVSLCRLTCFWISHLPPSDDSYGVCDQSTIHTAAQVFSPAFTPPTPTPTPLKHIVNLFGQPLFSANKPSMSNAGCKHACILPFSW